MPQSPQPPPSDNVPLWHKIEIMQWWARLPALTLMVILRQDIGYRIVSPLALGGMAFVMIAIAGLGGESRRPDDLLIFALAMLTMGFYQRYNRWQDFQRGIPHHTYYIGTSILQRLRWPEFLRRDRRVARYLDPIFCFIAGLIARTGSPILGGWIMFAALCLHVYEQAVHRKEFHRQLDTLDGMVDAQIQGNTVEHFEPPLEVQADKESPGIPTGLSPDIRRNINLRKRN